MKRARLRLYWSENAVSCPVILQHCPAVLLKKLLGKDKQKPVCCAPVIRKICEKSTSTGLRCRRRECAEALMWFTSCCWTLSCSHIAAPVVYSHLTINVSICRVWIVEFSKGSKFLPHGSSNLYSLHGRRQQRSKVI